MADNVSSDFADLAPLIADWALPTEDQRSERRWNASKADFERLYNGIMPRLPRILAYLATIPVNDIPEEAKPLFYLMLAFAECAPHTELYRGSPVVPNSFAAHRFAATHGGRLG
jgi:hypothetical protein